MSQPQEIDTKYIKTLLTRKEIKEAILILAKNSCDKFNGFAQIEDNYCFVDTSKYDVTEKVNENRSSR